jgi:PAS domain S-box-containing protein
MVLVLTTNSDLKSDIGRFLESEVKTIKYLDENKSTFKNIVEGKPHLILFDSQSYNDATYDLWRKLKTDKQANAIPVILLGEFNDGNKLESYIEAGFDDFISIPLKKQELVLRVKAQLAKLGSKRPSQDVLTKEFNTSNWKKKTNELRINEASYRTLFENSKDAFFIIDERGRIIHGNTAMVDVFGFDDISELINLAVWEMSPKWQAKGRNSEHLALEQIDATLKGDTRHFIWDHKRKDGTLFKAEVSIHGLKDREKNYVLCSLRDITDRINSEMALKESEEKFANVFNSSPVAQSILNFKTGHRINVNDAFSELFGYTKEKALPINVKTSPLAVDPTHLKEAIDLALATGKLENYAFDMYHSSGTIKHLIVNATNTVMGNENIFIVSYSDVTATLRAERRLKEAEEEIYNAIISSEEKERARYAKELHDGLGPILSTSLIYLHTLKDEEDSAKQSEYIDRTYALLEEATQSIREISSNLSPDILKKYGLIQAVRSFIERLQEVSKVNFKIKSNITTDFKEIIAFTLYRTLIELINNSIKHADAAKIVISFDQSPEGIRISYSDDGSGFDYKKVKKSNKGFGLTNLEGRIQKIGGKYKFTSKKGKGTQVLIKLQTI